MEFLKVCNKYIPIPFQLDAEQIAIYKNWIRKHNCKYAEKERETGKYLIGGRLLWEFRPTDVGCFIEIECLCGSKLDLTSE